MAEKQRKKGKEKIEYEDSIIIPATSSDPDKDLKLELELPPGAKLITDYEASHILEDFHTKYLEAINEENFKIPESFINALQYTKDAVHYNNVDSVKRYLGSLKEYGATDVEICVLANTAPETIEEAYALIPSLKEKKDGIEEPLSAVLGVLGSFKT